LFLKSIELCGFKSFATKTKFIFKHGVTAIVGPNGCGKSNVVDAIRWVLGESNARSIRGEIMDDVIFSGSEDRKPLGMAEVGITMVNDDELLPIEYSEVNIKRRLYRSGESEFLINKNNVRLKDIHELFADTGIGKAAYSIMEQGNIDMILSNKPEERIGIFEEAAGVTRYKMRMKQSYKKLAATEENLIRLNLIIHEVEKEYNALKKQAEKALQYKKLKKEEVEYETLYNYERIRNLKRQVEKNTEESDSLKKKKNDRMDEIIKLNNAIKQNIERVRSVEREIAEIKNGIYKKEAELESINSKSEHVKDRIFEIKNEIAKKNHLREKIQNYKLELEAKIEHLYTDKKAVSDLLVSQEEKLISYMKEIDYINDAIKKCSDQILTNTTHIEKVEETVQNLRDELKDVIDKLLKEMDSIKARFKGNEKRKNELIKSVTESITRIDNALRHHGTKLNDLVYTVKESDAHTFTRSLTEDIQNIREILAELRIDIETVINIQDDLSKMIFGKEGMYFRKEKSESIIEENVKNEKALNKKIVHLNEELKKNGEKKEEFGVIINNLRPDIARNKEKQKYYEENIKQLRHELERSDESFQDVEFNVKSLGERVKQLESELDKLSIRYKEFEEDKLLLGEKMKGHNALIDKIIDKIQHSESEVDVKKNRIENMTRTIEKVELNNAELSSKIETITENFKERYSVSLEIINPDSKARSSVTEAVLSSEPMDIKRINEQRERIKKEISELGQVNLIAIEDYNEVKKRFEYLTEQRDDMKKAKEDLNIVMAKTVKSSYELFMESFEKIGRNFNGIFRRLFNGGQTDLFLTNDANIFESGIEIMVCPPGKYLKRRSLLSGGETGLTAIALLFAIFMVKPSPFCMLDEVDHDLDEENVVRFLDLLKEFTDTTQFIIITHNRRTIEFADVIYGVTTEEAGVSKVVSLDLLEHSIE